MITDEKRPAASIAVDDLQRLFGATFSPWLRHRVESHDLSYFELDRDSSDDLILRVLKSLEDNWSQAGPERKQEWQRGWAENYDLLGVEGAVVNLIPKYFGKYPFLRWDGRFIRAASANLEYALFGILLDFVFDHFMSSASAVYEFGCGTGHNLVRARERLKSAKLHGLDWVTSSQDTVRKYAETNDPHLYAENFDFFEPDFSISVEENSHFLTVAALEQVGSRFEGFLSFVLSKRPALVVHVEPFAEMLNPDVLIDYLSIQYFRKRNYVSGFADTLLELDKSGAIEIVEARRSGIGSLYVDGYSLIVWRPR